MSRARNLAGFATAVYPVDNISVGFITCRDINITGVATFQNINVTSVEYAEVAGIATVAEGLTGTPDITVGSITGAAASFSGNVEVGANVDLTDSTVDLYSQTTNAASKTFQLFSDVGGTKVEKVFIDASGGASFSGDVSIADKIVHIGDTDTAIRFPANGTFSVDNNGTENLRLTQDGLLEVKGAQFGANITPTSGAGIEVFYATAESGLIQAFDRSNTGWDLLSIKGEPVELYNNNTKVFETADSGVIITGVATATAGTLIAGVGIRTEGSVATAAGAKSIDFRGSGVTTAIFDASSGISTVYIEGGSGGGGGAAAGFVFSYIMGV